MQREQLLHERAAVMEQSHVEPGHVLGEVGLTLLVKELSHERCDRDYLCWERPALDTGLQAHGRANAGQSGETRLIREVVFTAQSADRAALVDKPCERWMLAHRLAQLLEDLVQPVLPRARTELLGVDEQVDVFGEPFDQAPALRQARTAFEHCSVAERRFDDSQDLGDVVVLLDELLADAEVLGGPQHSLFELRMLE